MMLVKRVMSTSILLTLLFLGAGCQNDTEFTIKNSARFLRKNESYQSRAVSPFYQNNLPMVGRNSN